MPLRLAPRLAAVIATAPVALVACAGGNEAATPVPGCIEAESYDSGFERMSDLAQAPDASSSALASGAAIAADSAASGGFAVGSAAAGQSLAYSLSTPSAGSYTLGFLVSTPSDAALQASVDGVDVTGTLALPSFGSDAYHTVASGPVALTSGFHKLVVTFGGAVGAFDAIDVVPISGLPPTVTLHGHTYKYNSALSDEFNHSAVDNSKWLPTYNGGVQRLNDEWECFTQNKTRVATGHSLELVANKTGTSHSAGSCSAPNYQSGMIRSSAAQKYGYFVASMKMPAGGGMWPAFWLIPAPTVANSNSPPWPPEIDVMEMVNNGREGPYQVTQFLHGCGSKTDESLLNSWGDYPSSRSVTNFADGAYHQFAVEWTPKKLYLYVDGTLARTYDFDWDMKPPSGQTGLSDTSQCSVRDSGPANVIIDLAMGGQWPGDVDDQALPQSLDIDYVRAYSY